MTLQWLFVAGTLYTEVALISVLLLPFISPKTWQKLFRSRLASLISSYSYIYFNIFIAILVLLFLDSVREVWKYSGPVDNEELRRYPEAETAIHMKLFRAQRNMYIAGFALFLWFVLRRLAMLIGKEATLMAECEASMRQAQSATTAAQQLLDDKGTKDDNKKNSEAEAADDTGDKKASKSDQTHLEKELEETQTELEKTKEELYRARLEVGSIKKQAESTNMEYDRLLAEHAKLQKQLQDYEGGDAGDKKGN
ncbi:B-cell receptor-associated protein 31 [Plakobranchus ocellatus]|uniref:Endoplasmic reticulum transmembrane protein n=1 Tax=Plakobranchus ocellatus TaxID=259542 RepID=A0AAV4DI97_9GAST|nr:B-cell receptor-associated protein 31 [Plakobranchus ocellatus]